MDPDVLKQALPFLLGAALGLLALVAGILAARRIVRQAREAADRIQSDAHQDAESNVKEIVVAAQEKALSLDEEADRREREIEARESEIDTRLRDAERTATKIERQCDEIDQRQSRLARMEQTAGDERAALEADRQAARAELERVAGLTADEARAQIVSEIEQDAQRDAQQLVRKIHDEANERAEREALQLAVQATQRIHIKRAVETTVSFIELPNDEMKGRIIGREGRNIRALETATGIDLIVDDTPRSIVISSFDPVRREIARVAIGRLIEDGRIHPARIEEVVDRVRSEIDGLVEETGSQAAFELGVTDLHPRLNRLVGWMNLRTHHGQNLMQHCVEVALVAGYMASEVGGRVDLARRAGLLHEIGRVAHDVSGPSLLASAEIVTRYGESEEVAHAIRSLHRDVEAKSMEALLLQAADRVSTERPGARKENLEVFIERLRRLEEIARSFPGVCEAFAVKAGKELRVIVEAAEVSDPDAFGLSKKIARALEKELSFQGKIKVSVVRETRAVHFAV